MSVAAASAVLSSAWSTVVGVAQAAGLGAEVALIGGSVGKAVAALSALGPAAPATVAAYIIIRDLRKTRKGAEARMDCKGDALDFAMENAIGGINFVRLRTIPTTKWPKCWHKGLKTDGKRNGRQSTKLPLALGGAVVREDVLATSGVDAQRCWLGQVLQGPSKITTDQGLVLLPILGPFAFCRYVQAGRFLGLSPTAEAAAIAYSRSLLETRPDAARAQAATLLVRGTKYGAFKGPDGEACNALLRGFLA